MTRRLLLFLTLSAILTPAAFGLYGFFPNDKPVEAGDWPPAIVKALNAHRRVHGSGTSDMGHGWRFYFVGNTDDLNRFLAQVAEAKDVPLSLVLSPEPGTDKVFSQVEFSQETIEYSWSIHLVPEREHFIVIDKVPGETRAQYDERLRRVRDAMPEYTAKVTVHASGSIALERLKVPLAFKTSAGGDVASFVAVHNERREEAKRPDARPDAARPTVYTDTKRGGGLFGGAPAPATLPAR